MYKFITSTAVEGAVLPYIIAELEWLKIKW